MHGVLIDAKVEAHSDGYADWRISGPREIKMPIEGLAVAKR